MPISSKTSIAFALIAGLAPSVTAATPLRRHTAHRIDAISRYAHAPRRVGGRYGENVYAPTGPYGPSAVDYPAASAADDPYNPYAAPGAAVRAMARRNQFAPGVTNELAPDNIATATGGPAGGVPGFSGH